MNINFSDVFSNRFNDSTKAALNKILNCENRTGFSLFNVEGGKVRIVVDSGEAFEQQLIFEDVVFSEGFDISLYPYAFELYETDSGYCLEFNQDDTEEFQFRPKLCFSMVNAEIRCFNYTKSITCSYEPWRGLANLLYEIKIKGERIGPEFLSEEEKRFLPLAEFRPLAHFFSMGLKISYSKAASEIFISYAERVNASKIITLARKYERVANSNKEEAVSRKLQKAMTRIEAEPVYRMILNDIKSSAIIYPDKMDCCGDSYFAGQMRGSITSFFHSQGYHGDYPHFRKMSVLRGLHFLFIAGQLVALWNEKHMACYINCYEEYVNGYFSIHYAAGTVFLSGDQLDLFSELTADSGYFIDKDRRRARAVLSPVYWETEGYSLEDENLKAAQFAARVAQCTKITQEERKIYLSYNPMNMEAGHFLILLWLLGGSFFGIAMCIGFILMEVAAGLIFTGSWIRTLALIHETPWHWMFITSGGGFGLVMLIFSLIARKRG